MNSGEKTQMARQRTFSGKHPLENLVFGVILIALGIANVAFGLPSSSMTSAYWAATGVFVSLGASSIIRFLESKMSRENHLRPLASYGRLASLLVFAGFVVLLLWLRVNQ